MPGAIPRIVQTGGVGSNATSPTSSMGSTPTVGNVIVAALYTGVSPGGAQAVIDGGTAGSAWTKLAEASASGNTNTLSVGIWARIANGSIGSQIVQGSGCATLSRLVAFEVEGIDVTNYKAGTIDTVGATALTLSSGLVTPDTRAECPLFVVAAMGANAAMGGTPTVGPAAESVTNQAQDSRLLCGTLPITSVLLASGAFQNAGGYPAISVSGTFTGTARRAGLVVVGFRPRMPKTALLGVT